MSAGAGALERPQINLASPIGGAVALLVLIFIAERRARRREEALLRRLRQSRDAVTLPTDTIAVLTEQGKLCPRGLDHPVGSRVAGEECGACIAFAAEEAEIERREDEAETPPAAGRDAEPPPAPPPPPSPPAGPDA